MPAAAAPPPARAAGSVEAERPHLVPEEVERRRGDQRDRLRGDLRQAGQVDEQLENRGLDDEGAGADGEEARGLEARVTAARLEGPMPVPPEVVRHRDAEGHRRRDQMMDRENLDA